MIQKPSNIALTGPPASGKSTVGKELASALRKTFVDTDEELEKIFGYSISEYFEKHGEASFRKAESLLLADICQRQNQVIATGGGILLDSTNRDVITRTCIPINLSASLEDLLKRQKDSHHRPLLEGEREARLRRLMEDRKPVYDSIKIQIDTTNKTVEQITVEIMSILSTQST